MSLQSKNAIKQQLSNIEAINKDLEILNRIRQHQRSRQRKYVKGKKERGYTRVTLWLSCDKQLAAKIRDHLQNLPQEQLESMINK